jgi:hypothetical protein
MVFRPEIESKESREHSLLDGYHLATREDRAVQIATRVTRCIHLHTGRWTDGCVFGPTDTFSQNVNLNQETLILS